MKYGMKFGMSMISSAYSAERMKIMHRCFASLAKTDVSGLYFRPRMHIMIGDKPFDYLHYIAQWLEKWDVTYSENAVGSPTQMLIDCGEHLCLDPDVSHLVFLYDDFLFNNQWLKELQALIERHPSAKAWSVYRSNHQRHHKIIAKDEESGDVLMTMHDGMGCMTVEEWKMYDAKNVKDFTCGPEMGGGCTMDIYHAQARPGARWASSRDYWQNLGVHAGLEGKDCAIDFVGE